MANAQGKQSLESCQQIVWGKLQEVKHGKESHIPSAGWQPEIHLSDGYIVGYNHLTLILD
jgi:hypothetical protein